MRYQPEYFEKILTLRQPDEFVFLDSCVLINGDHNLNHLRNISDVLAHHSGWFVTPSVRSEYKVGINGFKKRSRTIERHHTHAPKKYSPLKETNCSREVIQARERVLSLIGREAHNPFSERHLAPKTLENYHELFPKVRTLFESYAGEVHETDIDLVSICLAHALDGKKVILASNDRNLTQTFCDSSRNVSWRLKNGTGPKIPVYDGENRFFDYAHMSYLKH
jgi:hypothetical protein